MNQAAPCSPQPRTRWPGPVNVLEYDRTPLLSEAEHAELDRVLHLPHSQIRQRARCILQRLCASH